MRLVTALHFVSSFLHCAIRALFFAAGVAEAIGRRFFDFGAGFGAFFGAGFVAGLGLGAFGFVAGGEEAGAGAARLFAAAGLFAGLGGFRF